MKVVLFCGGYGMRMRHAQDDVLPKPMQLVGPRPLLWHVMRYYAHFGHTEFILCLGYGAEHIKKFFLDYSETTSNDFVLTGGHVDVLTSDLQDWRITFINTGAATPIGERLRLVRDHLDGDEMFLANYADVLSDLPLDEMIGAVQASGAAAGILAVPPQQSFHCLDMDDRSMVTGITPVSRLPLWENGGYFVLTQEIFDHLPRDGDLVSDACEALATRRRLFAFRHQGFWKPADTFKERADLDLAWDNGSHPWALWLKPAVVQ